MQTKLSRYAEGVMEAAWLAAAITAPLFFNVYSSRIFEPDKTTLLRSLALVILGAWLVKALDQGQAALSRWKEVLRIPVVLPVATLAAVTLISTLFSVVPYSSVFGSYQRLQGAYTLLAYLVIFAALLGNLRRREQVERLITAMILASVPVSLYGVLQRFGLDPIPWGGDTQYRITSTLGNSIFAAAYLIMAFPLTLMRIYRAFKDLFDARENLIPRFFLATVLVFIAGMQVIAIYFTQSRGPALGWLFSLFFMGLLYALCWRKRWLAYTIAVSSLLGAGFLFILNLPDGPLESLRSSPGVGRFGQLLDSESRNAKVRRIIWEGAAKLVKPHDPILYPDGSSDRFNFLRPLIGYGPESMYVAYNPFYPPELTQVEKRNASPDRSHNETWDSLVTGGVLGLGAYLFLFTSVFYYGLKWLELIAGNRQRKLFLALFLGGGLAGAVIFTIWRGIAYLGVGLPFGMLIGLVVYILIAVALGAGPVLNNQGKQARAALLIGLLGVIGAHFVEINFGIAIVSTRTYFFLAAALLLLVGSILPRQGLFGSAPETASDVDAGAGEKLGYEEEVKNPRYGGKKKRRGSKVSAVQASPGLSAVWREALIGACLLGIILITLGFNFLSNAANARSAVTIIWNSLTTLPTAGGEVSYAVLGLSLLTLVVGGVVLASENDLAGTRGLWLKAFGLVMGGAVILALVFWFWHASSLAGLARTTPDTLDEIILKISKFEALLSHYYFSLLVVILLAGSLLPAAWPARSQRGSWVVAFAAPATFVLVLIASIYTNLRVIQADIAFKLGDPYAASGEWAGAVSVYNRANQLAPGEDFYYLFLGRAYLEYAKTLGSPTEQDSLMTQAASDLKKAQQLNPLNTDHTANLARMYSLWAASSQDPQLHQERSQISSDYFAQALTLSPTNARLWDEWALLSMNVIGDTQAAEARLKRSLELDPFYDWSYALLGDYYGRVAQTMPEDRKDERAKILQKASQAYQQALELSEDPNLMYSYALALAGVERQLNQPSGAIEAYQRALSISPANPDRWKIEENIARLHAENGNLSDALLHAQNALDTAPDDQKTRLQELVAQLGNHQP